MDQNQPQQKGSKAPYILSLITTILMFLGGVNSIIGGVSFKTVEKTQLFSELTKQAGDQNVSFNLFGNIFGSIGTLLIVLGIITIFLAVIMIFATILSKKEEFKKAGIILLVCSVLGFLTGNIVAPIIGLIAGILNVVKKTD